MHGKREVSALLRHARQQAAIDALPYHRVCSCCRKRISREVKTHDLYHSPSKERARLSGLMACGLVWVCALCAVRISERKCADVAEAVATHRDAGGVVLFLTFTVAHRARPDGSHLALRPLLDRFLTAMDNMTRNRPYRRLLAEVGKVGTIKALEVTWGASNGFHPHAHLLLFLRPLQRLDVALFTQRLYDCWQPAARAQGLVMSRKRGVQAQDTYGAVADYFAKFGVAAAWGPEREMTKWHYKGGNIVNGERRYTPFELLDEWKISFDGAFATRFREYAAAFKGRRQLVWSRGLRALLLADPDELDDEQLAGLADDDEVLIGQVAAALYAHVVSQRKVGRFFAIADRGDMAAVDAFLADVRQEAAELALDELDEPLIDRISDEVDPLQFIDLADVAPAGVLPLVPAGAAAVLPW